MFMTKVKVTAALMLVLSAAAVGSSALWGQKPSVPGTDKVAVAVPEPAAKRTRFNDVNDFKTADSTE